MHRPSFIVHRPSFIVRHPLSVVWIGGMHGWARFRAGHDLGLDILMHGWARFRAGHYLGLDILMWTIQMGCAGGYDGVGMSVVSVPGVDMITSAKVDYGGFIPPVIIETLSVRCSGPVC